MYIGTCIQTIYQYINISILTTTASITVAAAVVEKCAVAVTANRLLR